MRNWTVSVGHYAHGGTVALVGVYIGPALAVRSMDAMDPTRTSSVVCPLALAHCPTGKATCCNPCGVAALATLAVWYSCVCSDRTYLAHIQPTLAAGFFVEHWGLEWRACDSDLVRPDPVAGTMALAR